MYIYIYIYLRMVVPTDSAVLRFPLRHFTVLPFRRYACRCMFPVSALPFLANAEFQEPNIIIYLLVLLSLYFLMYISFCMFLFVVCFCSATPLSVSRATLRCQLLINHPSARLYMARETRPCCTT